MILIKIYYILCRNKTFIDINNQTVFESARLRNVELPRPIVWQDSLFKEDKFNTRPYRLTPFESHGSHSSELSLSDRDNITSLWLTSNSVLFRCRGQVIINVAEREITMNVAIPFVFRSQSAELRLTREFLPFISVSSKRLYFMSLLRPYGSLCWGENEGRFAGVRIMLEDTI